LFEFLLLTDLSRDNLLSGSTDISAICELANCFPNIEIRFLPSIHAKVYVADENLAIVTSSNMTNKGLMQNFEYGVKIQDTNLVQ
jgi:HKD family nuclease